MTAYERALKLNDSASTHYRGDRGDLPPTATTAIGSTEAMLGPV